MINSWIKRKNESMSVAVGMCLRAWRCITSPNKFSHTHGNTTMILLCTRCLCSPLLSPWQIPLAFIFLHTISFSFSQAGILCCFFQDFLFEISLPIVLNANILFNRMLLTLHYDFWMSLLLNVYRLISYKTVAYFVHGVLNG